MDRKFLIQSGLLITLIFVSLAYATNTFPSLSWNPFPPEQLAKKQIIVGQTTLTAEIADTPAARQKGLGGRDALAKDNGMLFVFQTAGKYPFWMKGLTFPLDIIWIKDKKVVDVIKNAALPQDGVNDDALPRYVSNQDIDMALEVNAGFVDEHHIQVGDQVTIADQ